MSTGVVIDSPIPPNTAARAAEFIGQATAVEQARAVAEVQAAIVVAQQCPRNMQIAVAAMRESCKQKALADRAFFRYARAGSTITGPSVHLARELARCFGNVQYGISELRRDDTKGESEMLAFAWDVQMNTRAAHIFIVPHRRDTKKGVVALTDMRDIYENNANNGARRLREAIFAILPVWFTEEAKDLCDATIRDGGGKPLAQRVADATKAFESKGVTIDQLEQKLGRRADKWNEHDVAQLLVTYTSLQRGEITVDEEFPQKRVTAEEIIRQGTVDTDTGEVTDDPPARAARMISQRQRGLLMSLYSQLGITDRDERLADLANFVQHDVATSSDLTADEAKTVLDWLQMRVDGPDGPGGDTP